MGKGAGEKDVSALYHAIGKAMMDENFRELLFSNPKAAAQSMGVEKCVIDGVLSLGEAGFAEFAKKYEAEIAKVAGGAIFCANY
ncbi:MAG: hypothetical protein GY800_13940 [Planctomycetes bacterium]|nr:hypothetical protein [Planctomycetota bacterium]